MLNKIYPNFFPNGPDHVKSEMRLLDQQKVEVRYQDINNVDPQFSVAAGNILFQTSSLSIQSF